MTSSVKLCPFSSNLSFACIIQLFSAPPRFLYHASRELLAVLTELFLNESSCWRYGLRI